MTTTATAPPTPPPRPPLPPPPPPPQRKLSSKIKKLSTNFENLNPDNTDRGNDNQMQCHHPKEQQSQLVHEKPHDQQSLQADEKPQDQQSLQVDEKPQDQKPLQADEKPQELKPQQVDELQEEQKSLQADEMPQEQKPQQVDEKPQEQQSLQADEKAQEQKPQQVDEKPQAQKPLQVDEKPSPPKLIHLTLNKPMGIVFQSMLDPDNSSRQRGVVISDLPSKGAAAQSGKLEVGDELVSVNNKTVSHLTFDEIMDVILDANPTNVNLVLQRPRKENLPYTPVINSLPTESTVTTTPREIKQKTVPEQISTRNFSLSIDKAVLRGDKHRASEKIDHRVDRRRRTRRERAQDEPDLLDLLLDSFCSPIIGPNELLNDDDFDHDDETSYAKSVMKGITGPSILLEGRKYISAVNAACSAGPRAIQLPVDEYIMEKYGLDYPTKFGSTREETIQRDPSKFYKYVVKGLLRENEPKRVPQMNKLLIKYKGREPYLIQKLSARYNYTGSGARDREKVMSSNQPQHNKLNEDDRFDTLTRVKGKDINIADEGLHSIEENNPISSSSSSDEENKFDDAVSHSSLVETSFPSDPIESTSTDVIAQVSELLDYIYGQTSVSGQIKRVSTVMRAHEGQEAKLLKLLKAKALQKANESKAAKNLPTLLRDQPVSHKINYNKNPVHVPISPKSTQTDHSDVTPKAKN